LPAVPSVALILPANIEKLLRDNQIVLPEGNVISTNRLISSNNGVILFQDFLRPLGNPVVVKYIPDTWMTSADYFSSGATYIVCVRRIPSINLNPQLARYLVSPEAYYDPNFGFVVILRPQRFIYCNQQTELIMIIDTYAPRVMEVLGYGDVITRYYKDDALGKFLISSDVLIKGFCNIITTACNMDDDLIYFNDLHRRNVMINRHTGQIKIVDYGGFIFGQELFTQILQIYRQNGVNLPRLSNVYKFASTFGGINQPVPLNQYRNQLILIHHILGYDLYISAGFTCDYLNNRILRQSVPTSQYLLDFQTAIPVFFQNMASKLSTANKRRLVCL
ncbi:unnamed protein product, partial [Didymodactylos carnosus]